MAGFLLNDKAKVSCMHSAQAKPTMVNPKVKVDGQPIVLQTTAYSVSGCSNKLPGSPPVPFPCLVAQWVKAATRVKSNKIPVLLLDSKAMCTPTGMKAKIAKTQNKVKGR